MRSVDFLLDLLTRCEQVDVYGLDVFFISFFFCVCVFSLDVRMISYDYIHHFSKIISCVFVFFMLLKPQYARYSFLSCALDRFVVCSGSIHLVNKSVLMIPIPPALHWQKVEAVELQHLGP